MRRRHRCHIKRKSPSNRRSMAYHDPPAEMRYVECLPKLSRSQPLVIQAGLVGLVLLAAPSEVFPKISQNFSPAGVTSPFVARAMPTDSTSVVPVSGR